MAASSALTFAPMSVADFYGAFMERLRHLGIDVQIWTMPSEIENAVPFEQDRTHAHYDPDYVTRFHHATVQAARVMNEFRARFIGKVSPVHFFWGSFDLAVTRFSGRTAPPPTSATPNVASWVMTKPIRTRSRAAAFGRATAAMAAPPSMCMPIRSPRVTATRACP